MRSVNPSLETSHGASGTSYNKMAAWLIFFLWIAYLLNYCDRQVVYAIFPVLKSELGFTNAQLGLTSSLFIWATGITSPFAGTLGDRYSRQRVVLWTLMLWSIVTALTGVANSPSAVLTCRALLGITEAVFIPVAVSLIGNTLPAQLRSRAVALFFSAQLIGVVVGGSAGGWIGEHLGWRLAFFGLGIVGALFAIPLGWFLRGFRETQIHDKPGELTRSHFAELASVPSYIALCISFPSFLMMLTIMYSWLPAFLHDRFTLSLTEAGFRATVFLQTGTGLGLLFGSSCSDRLYRRYPQARYWLIASSMVFAAPWIYLLSHGSLPMAELSAAGFGLANGLFTSNIMIAPFDVIPVGARTTAVAVINTIAPPFTGLASYLTGVYKDRIGIPNLMNIFAALLVISGVGLLLGTAMLFEKDHRRAAKDAL
jgi:predicted MFS family arabinose efflux permease